MRLAVLAAALASALVAISMIAWMSAHPRRSYSSQSPKRWIEPDDGVQGDSRTWTLVADTSSVVAWRWGWPSA